VPHFWLALLVWLHCSVQISVQLVLQTVLFDGIQFGGITVQFCVQTMEHTYTGDEEHICMGYMPSAKDLGVSMETDELVVGRTNEGSKGLLPMLK